MGQVIVLTQPRTIALERYEDRPLEPGEVRLRTLYSGISAGTELATYRGSNPSLHKRWDPDRRLFTAADAPGQAYPVSTWGYEEVGEVVERGAEVRAVQVGDLIYGAWGHRTHHITDEEYVRGRILPAGLEPILGIFSHIGAVALNGVHDAAIRIGETVAIFGLGVPGQIVAQLAKGSGVAVIGVDLLEARLAKARETGAIDVAINPAEGNTAERIKALTGGRGADVSFEVSGSTVALHQAIRATAYSGKVVALGFYQGDASGLFLGEEFHHNRITVVGSQISGINPELTYRWNRLRLAQTVMRLQAEGRLNLRPLITHVHPFEHAAEAFRLLDQHPAEALQVVLDCTL
ncbi:MAG: zinc-binding dehydrogenase [Ardenticatenaceae bacterium]|nr:zinc-binding dehydrogenase [Ardenticatenaceae bacterium]